MIRRFLPVLVFTLVALRPVVAPAQDGSSRVEVRQGLDYVRVHDLAEDLPLVAGALDASRLIIDLRFVGADAGQATKLAALLGRETPQAGRPKDQIILVLINNHTAESVGAMLQSIRETDHLVLVGQPTEGSPGAEPDLPVEAEPDADDIAYRAFDEGTPLAALLDPPVQKARFDEATLLSRFSGRSPSRDGSSPSASSSQTSSSSTPHPYDRILHRAVNALIAVEALTSAAPL